MTKETLRPPLLALLVPLLSSFLFLAVILVPELFKKLRETPGNNFHLVSSKSESGCPSYVPNKRNNIVEPDGHEGKPMKIKEILIFSSFVFSIF